MVGRRPGRAGGGQLSPGSYQNAARAPFNGSFPGLSVTGNGRGCNTVKGSFDITALSSDSHGRVTTLDASFTQFCDGGAGALRGSIRVRGAPRRGRRAHVREPDVGRGPVRRPQREGPPRYERQRHLPRRIDRSRQQQRGQRGCREVGHRVAERRDAHLHRGPGRDDVDAEDLGPRHPDRAAWRDVPVLPQRQRRLHRAGRHGELPRPRCRHHGPRLRPRDRHYLRRRGRRAMVGRPRGADRPGPRPRHVHRRRTRRRSALPATRGSTSPATAAAATR